MGNLQPLRQLWEWCQVPALTVPPIDTRERVSLATAERDLFFALVKVATYLLMWLTTSALPGRGLHQLGERQVTTIAHLHCQALSSSERRWRGRSGGRRVQSHWATHRSHLRVFRTNTTCKLRWDANESDENVSVSRSTDAGESAWQEGTAVPDAAREGTLLSSELDDGLLGIVSQLPVKRILIWAAFSWLVYLCRPFMGVLFGTFVVSYVGVSFCQWGTRFLRRFGIDAPRRVIVGIYYSGIALFITTMSLLTIPRIIKEGQYFVGIIRSSNPYVWIADTMRRALGDELSAKVEALVLSEGYAEPTENDGIPGAGSGSPSVAPETSDHPTDSTSGIVRIRVPLSGEIRTETGSDSLRISRNGIPSTVAAPAQWTEERSRRLGLVIQKSLSRYVNRFASIVSRILSNSTKIIVKVLLSLVFSFLIVWDLPSVAAGLRSLRRSRLRAAYLELAPAIGEFCTLLGRSFEAQSIIALVNTTLTTIGMGVLGLPGIGFLSLLCLVCSFIPLFGILLSTLPMCVVALTEYGPMRAFAVVIMVAIVHLIEAYFLNPQIYSAHLKLPPLIVLMVLYIGEHAGGVMGLILAVPLTVYLLRWIYDLPETSAKRMEKARRRSDAENGFEDRDGRLMMQPQSPES